MPKIIPLMKTKLITNIKQLAGILPKGVSMLKGGEMNQVKTIENAWLRIEDEHIADFGPMSDFPQGDLHEEVVIDATDKILMPAFVDSHTHIVFAGTREDEFEMRLNGISYEEIAAKGGGIINSAKKLQAATADDLFESALSRVHQVVALGTGALEIKSGYGLTVDAELKMLRVIKRLTEETGIIIKATFLGAHAVPPEFAGKADDYLDMLINEALPVISEENLADYVDVFCEKGYFNVNQTNRLLDAALKHDLKPKIHVNQFYSIGGVQAGVNHHAVSVDHLEVMTDADFAALENSSTIATILPGCSLFIEIPYGPARELINREIPVALATDYNPGSAPSGNMQLMQSLACVKMKMTPNEAFNASTINAAAAINESERLGSITKGKKANLLLTHKIPSLGFMAYNFGHNHIEKVFLAGEEFKPHGK